MSGSRVSGVANDRGASEREGQHARRPLSQAHSPSPSLIANLRDELMRKPPFSGMQQAQVEALVRAAEQV